MRVSFLLTPFLALLAASQSSSADGPNAFKVPTGGYSITAGKSVTLDWTPTTSGTVTLVLRSGNANFLNEGTLIDSDIQNTGSYVWDVPSDITKGDDYTVEIISDLDPSETNYTPPFPIDSTNTTPSSTSIVTIPTPSMTSSSAASSSATSTDMSMTSMTTMTSMASTSSSMASVTVASTSTTSNSEVVMTPTSTSTGAAAARRTQGAMGALAIFGGALAVVL